jgi:uncharacterized protein YbjT (DUF2867 family)
MIVVTGATGKIGRELMRLLSERREAVQAVAHTDLAQPDRLASAFAGAEKLFLLTANSEDMVRLQKNAVEAARKFGVRHVVKLSALGATDHSKSVIGLWHYNVERVLRESGLAWTFLRPHAFMDNLLDQRDNIAREGVVYSPAGEGRVPLIDTRDIAAAAAVTLTQPGHEGKIYTLTGPQSLSYRQATEILSRVIGRPLKYVPESEDDAWVRLRRAGLPVWQIAAFLTIAAYQREGGLTEKVTPTLEQLIGRPARTFEQFARERFTES